MKTKTLGGGRRLIAAVQSCALCAALMGSTARSAVFSDQAALDQSAIFAGNTIFDGVVAVSVIENNGWYAGSGVVVGDGSWILTAGHVITTAASQGNTITQIRANAGTDAYNPTARGYADSWYVYPGYTGGVGLGVDLALIHLSAPMTSVTPAELYTGSQSSLTGVMALMAGYGAPGTAGNGIGAFDGIRRAGGNVIGDVSYPSADPQYLVSRFDSPQSGLSVALEWQGSQGDSGGPWMVQDSGIWKVAAISSGVNHDPNFSFGDVTFANNVFDYLGWIQSYTSVPEPTTAAVVALGLACLLGRGKRNTT